MSFGETGPSEHVTLLERVVSEFARQGCVACYGAGRVLSEFL